MAKQTNKTDPTVKKTSSGTKAKKPAPFPETEATETTNQAAVKAPKPGKAVKKK